MDFKEKPVNLLVQARKVFLFFCFSFLFFFVVLNVIQFFNFTSRQAAVLAETKIAALLDSSETSFSRVLPDSEEKKPDFVFTAKENSLEIPMIGIVAPLVFAQTEEIKEIVQDLNRGVVAYPGPFLPGRGGNLVVLGHSAPPFWPKIRYEWVFSKLNDLKPGDEVLVNFEKRRYRYQVTRKIFLDKGEEIPVRGKEDSPQFLYLVTCWPPGRDLRRIVIEAVLTDSVGLTEN